MKGPMNSVEYHLGELAVAKDPSDVRRIIPEVHPDERVLDIGCGAGQSLIVIASTKPSYGIDIEIEALKLGKTLAKEIRFSAARGEALPFRDAAFDLVFSRVAIPYMKIDQALKEARRVLKPGGRVWFTLHDARTAFTRLRSAKSPRALLYALYVLGNGLLFNLAGLQITIGHRCETFQTSAGFARSLKRAGFVDVQIKRERHFVVTARLPA